jgi:hypothetical protein
MRRAMAVCLALALANPLGAQVSTSDPDVALGIQQVEEGDYDAAILTLDNAARRLSADPARSRELSAAYLYLGVAYVGKGHEAAARAKFREAVKQLRDLTLSPEKFPPKVIDLFEAAREDVARAPAAPPPAAASTSVPEKKGGSKVLIFGALGAAAAGGAVLALKKGDESGCDTAFGDRAGILALPSDATADVVGGPAIEPGLWVGELTWTGGAADSQIELKALDGGGQLIMQGGLIATRERKVEWSGQAGVIYTVRAVLLSGGPVNFELAISGPCLN